VVALCEMGQQYYVEWLHVLQCTSMGWVGDVCKLCAAGSLCSINPESLRYPSERFPVGAHGLQTTRPGHTLRLNTGPLARPSFELSLAAGVYQSNAGYVSCIIESESTLYVRWL